MAEDAQIQPENNKRVYGRPFRKGVSGNPGGRPKNNHTSIWNLLEKRLEELVPGSDKTAKDAVVMAILASLLDRKGKHFAAILKEASDRLYGKPKESIELSGKDGGPIEIDDARERIASRLAEYAAKQSAQDDTGGTVK